MKGPIVWLGQKRKEKKRKTHWSLLSLILSLIYLFFSLNVERKGSLKMLGFWKPQWCEKRASQVARRCSQTRVHGYLPPSSAGGAGTGEPIRNLSLRAWFCDTGRVVAPGARGSLPLQWTRASLPAAPPPPPGRAQGAGCVRGTEALGIAAAAGA